MNRALIYTLIGAGILFLFRARVRTGLVIGTEALIDMATPRGIRNNNPGNIRHSSSKWQGQSSQQPDLAFVRFDSPEYGIRALTKILLNYQSKYGLRTIRQLISRYAPPTENVTDAYVNTVAKKAGIGGDDAIDLYAKPDVLTRIVTAIIAHENGQQPYANTMIAKAVKSAYA